MRRARMPTVPVLAPQCFPIVQKGCGNIENMLQGCRIVGDRMMKCGGSESWGI